MKERVQPHNNRPQTVLNVGKKIFFSMFMLVIPLILLLLFEFSLRLFNYGGDVDLILKKKIADADYYYINKNVARRFFSFQDINIPAARTAVFKKEKTPETYRIFCLGGSSTAGFPFEFNATFPSLLKDRLDTLFPDRNIEVINVGISAINSYSVLDFTRELVHYEPDLFIIYMGHNEFYGALGIGSTQQIGENRNWILFYIKLQKIRTFLLVRNIIGKVSGLIHPKSSQQLMDQTLMEQVVKNRSIALNSQEYQIARDYFSENLDEIVRTAQKGGAKVILSTLVSNLADQEPFSLEFSPDLKPVQIQRWKGYMEEGFQLEKAGKLNEALLQYHQAEKIDATPALLYYRRAKCLQMSGVPDVAYKEYITAKDEDALRFRASSDFNEVIREIGRKNNVPVVPMEEVFKPYCRDNIPDRMLFTDHLHPNFPGYFWMARAFCERMSAIGCIVPSNQWDWKSDKSTDAYRRLAGVTDLDLEIANQRIRKLTKHWPFKSEVILRQNTGSDYDRLIESTVSDLMDRKLGWNEAHYRIAGYLQSRAEYDAAAREYEAVIKVTPFNYYPYLELANLQMRLQQYDRAEETLKKALSCSAHLPFAYAKLGMLYFFTDRTKPAMENLEKSIEIDGRTHRFDKDELAGAYYLLSMAYAKSGQLHLARESARSALKIKPNFKEVQEILTQLEAKL